MKTPTLRSIHLSLPQPVVVFGSVLLFANADHFSWVTNRWHFAFDLMMAPLLVISVVERVGSGTGRELSILSGMILPFRSTAVLRSP